MPTDGDAPASTRGSTALDPVSNAVDVGLARVLVAATRLRAKALPEGRWIVGNDGDRRLQASSAAPGDGAIGEESLEIVVRLVPVNPTSVHVEVELGGWVTRISRTPVATTSDDASDEASDDDERLEVVGLALDLVGAACFGDVRVHQVRRGSRLVEARVELAVAGGWSTIGEVRRLAWPFGLRTRRLLCNHEPRPHDCEAIQGPPLPWAPWAGRAGFVGRAAPSTQLVDLGRGGILDLHGMEPRRVDQVVSEFITTSQRDGVLALRIVHGKGKGVFRDIVHRRLRSHPAVKDFRIAGHGAGGWGATLVDLHPPGAPSSAASGQPSTS